MPIYTYRCPSCDSPFEKVLRVAECSDPQACPDCGHSPATKTITAVNFVSMGYDKLRSHMFEGNKRVDHLMEQRRRDEPQVTLVPNVDGERVDSWSEAKRLVESKGKAGSTYEPLIQKEQTLKSKIVTE